MKKITVTILTLMLVFAAVTPAFAFTFRNAANLKNADKPFIDLSDLIGDAELGKGGNAETSLSGNTDAETPDEGGTGKAGVAAEVIREDITKVEMVVTVHDTEIKVNGVTERDVDVFKADLQAKYKPGMDIRLIDDYAEYNTYSDVLSVFEELKLRPNEEQKQ